jgi:hypothetical protein
VNYEDMYFEEAYEEGGTGLDIDRQEYGQEYESEYGKEYFEDDEPQEPQMEQDEYSNEYTEGFDGTEDYAMPFGDTDPDQTQPTTEDELLGELPTQRQMDPTQAIAFAKDVLKSIGEDPYKGIPVDLAFLLRFWDTMYHNPILFWKCRQINKMVRVSLGTATAGWSYAVIIVKFKYITNTIGGLLELVNGPIGAIGLGINVRSLLNFVLKLPIIQQALQLLRKVGLPILEKTGILLRENPMLESKAVRIAQAMFPEMFPDYVPPGGKGRAKFDRERNRQDIKSGASRAPKKSYNGFASKKNMQKAQRAAQYAHPEMNINTNNKKKKDKV